MWWYTRDSIFFCHWYRSIYLHTSQQYISLTLQISENHICHWHGIKKGPVAQIMALSSLILIFFFWVGPGIIFVNSVPRVLCYATGEKSEPNAPNRWPRKLITPGVGHFVRTVLLECIRSFVTEQNHPLWTRPAMLCVRSQANSMTIIH